LFVTIVCHHHKRVIVNRMNQILITLDIIVKNNISRGIDLR
jgi:site-specific DNA-adenine methylase